MAFLFRTTDTVICVHAQDPDAVDPKHKTPSDLWILAKGQPKTCTRIEVRALAQHELIAVQSADEGDQKACELGLIKLDGKPPNYEELLPASVHAIAELVVIAAMFPFLGRSLQIEQTTVDP